MHALRQKLKRLNTIAYVIGPIRNLFSSTKLAKTFGIALLHKHFALGETERLIDYRNISVPWLIGNDTKAIITKYEGFTIPRSFRLINRQFVRYEFDYSLNSYLAQTNSAFVNELSSLLSELKLDHILGLKYLDKLAHDSELTVEVTKGKDNIMITRGIFSGE